MEGRGGLFLLCVLSPFSVLFFFLVAVGMSFFLGHSFLMKYLCSLKKS